MASSPHTKAYYSLFERGAHGVSHHKKIIKAGKVIIDKRVLAANSSEA